LQWSGKVGYEQVKSRIEEVNSVPQEAKRDEKIHNVETMVELRKYQATT
jgi:hypothetical protein